MTDFRIRVVVDPSGAQRGTRRVGRELEGVERRANRLRQTLTRTFALLGGGALLIGGVRTLASFGQEMSTVQAISRATGDEFRALTEEAQRLGTTTRFAASEAAQGMTFLARAGFDATETLETIDDTLRLAQAGALGLGQAADIASNVLTGFRLQTSEATRVVDVLALAANSANTDVSQLGQAIKFVGPVAAGVGVELEETTAAIAALSNAGLQASLAGTGLRRVLAELESPAEKTRQIFSDLGISAEEVRVSQVGLTEALRVLADAGVDTGTALEIFGQRGGPAFEVLRTSIPSIEGMTVALGDADGTAQRIAETMDDNLNGALLAVRSAFEGLILAFGQAGTTGGLETALRGLASVLRTLAQNIDEVVNTLVVLGAGFAAIKLAPLLTSLATAVQRFVALRIAVASGRAVVLGSAEATRQQALAELQAAEATAANTAAQLAAIKAHQAKALVVRGSTQATFAQAAVQKQVVAATAANTAAQGALAAAQARATVATKAATVAGRALNATFAVNPFVLLIAGAAATVVALRKLDEFLGLTADANEQAAAGVGAHLTQYGKLGAELLRVEANLDKAKDALERQGGESVLLTQRIETLTARAEKLREAQERMRNSTDAARRAAQEQAKAIINLESGYEGLIDKLDQAVEDAQLFGRELEVQQRLRETIAALEEEGATVSSERREIIEERIRRNLALEDEKKLLEEILEPQEMFQRSLAALEELERQGRISTEEYEQALARLQERFSQGIPQVPSEPESPETPGDEGGPFGPPPPEEFAPAAGPGIEPQQNVAVLGGALGDLREENELRARRLELVRQEGIAREAANVIAQAELELGRQLTEAERAALDSDLARREALDAETDALRRQQEVLEAIRGPQEELMRFQATVEELWRTGAISAEEYARALELVREKQDRLGTEGEASIGAYGETAELVFSRVGDAVAEFTRTGELEFQEFAANLAIEASKLLAQEAIKELIASLSSSSGGGGGGGGGVAGAALSILGSAFAAAQEGANVDRAGRTFLVGEEGPELFTAPGAGRIVPAGETAAMMGRAAAPTVNVSAPPAQVNVVNVRDPSEIPSAIESEPGAQSVINALAMKQGAAKRILGTGTT